VLAPVGRFATLGTDPLPLSTCGRERVLIAAVEDDHNARVACVGLHVRAIEQETDAGTVLVCLTEGQQDRLAIGRTFLSGAMRQKAMVGVGPWFRIWRLEAFRAGDADGRTPTPLERSLEQAREHPFERQTLEVVDQHFRRRRLAHPPVLASPTQSINECIR